MIPQSKVDKLYQAFQDYAAADLHEFSPLNNAVRMAEEIKHLQSTPLRELNGEQLAYFAFKTMTTWGSVDTFKHFLPRMLELSPNEPIHLDLPGLLGKLNYAQWESWPSEEQTAVQDFVFEYWQALITSEEKGSSYELSQFLSAALDAGFAPASLLESWQLIDKEPGLGRLVDFILINYPDIFVRNRFGRSKIKREEHAQLMQKWLCSKDMLDKLTWHFFQFENAHLAENISKALTYLEDWKKWNTAADPDLS